MEFLLEKKEIDFKKIPENPYEQINIWCFQDYSMNILVISVRIIIFQNFIDSEKLMAW